MTIFRCDQGETYFEAAAALAGMMYVVSEPLVGGRFGMMHLRDNNLHVVPDILERLGVMEDQGLYHTFVADWRPDQPLKLVQNGTEPSSLDLHDALEFCSYWYVSNPSMTLTELNARKKIQEVRDLSRQEHPEFNWVNREDFVWTGNFAEDADCVIEQYWSRRANAFTPANREGQRQP